MLTRLRQQASAACNFNQLRHPVAASHQRSEPFDGCDTRSIFDRDRLAANDIEALPERVEQLVAAFRNTKRIANAASIDPHIAEIVRFERQNRRLRASPRAKRAL